MDTPNSKTNMPSNPFHRDAPIPDAKHPMDDFQGGGPSINGWSIRDAVGSLTPQDSSTIDRKGK